MNRAVLDESSDAASRARVDSEMGRKLEERKRRIQSVLVTRLVGERDLSDWIVGVKKDEVDGDAAVLSAQVGDKSFESLEEGQVIDVSLAVTQSTSVETNESNESSSPSSPAASPTRNNKSTSTTPPSTPVITTATSTSSTCIDLKKISNEMQNKLQTSITNCTHHTSCHTSSSSNNNQGNSCLDTSQHNKLPKNNSLLLHNEECNICLSTFQIGDRIAWSHKNQMNLPQETVGQTNPSNDGICRHIFHAECIERWLLVREGCPVCRRSYFDELVNGDGGGVNADVVSNDGRGEEDIESGRGVGASSNLARLVVVEEE